MMGIRSRCHRQKANVWNATDFCVWGSGFLGCIRVSADGILSLAFIIIASLMVALNPSPIHKKTNLVKGNGNHVMILFSCIVKYVQFGNFWRQPKIDELLGDEICRDGSVYFSRNRLIGHYTPWCTLTYFLCIAIPFFWVSISSHCWWWLITMHSQVISRQQIELLGW